MRALLILFLLPFLSVACGPVAKAPPVTNEEALSEVRLQKKMAAEEHMAQLERLYRIGSPILAANAPLCGNKIWPYHGLMVESLSNLDNEARDAMEIYYGLSSQLTVLYVVPGSPSDGKLQRGDRIHKLNGVEIPSGVRGRKKFYETILKADEKSPLDFVISRRDGKEQNIIVQAVPACISNLVYELSDEVNAYADGTNIIFSTGMMRFADNDAMVAMIFAHELAHNALLHSKKKILNSVVSDLAALMIADLTGFDFSDMFDEMMTGAYSQDFESEADYVGLYMLARAGGYDLEEGIQIFRRLGATYPDSIHLAGTTHPSTAKRIIALKKTLVEIDRKKAAGLPLIPDEKGLFDSIDLP